MKKSNLWIGIIVVIFVIFALFSFKKTLTPYVSFEEAKQAQSTVQIAGKLVQGSPHYDEKEHRLYFVMQALDNQGQLPIVYEGPKPANFEKALSIVAIGYWDGQQFWARKLLVKCPSKYQGEETQREYGSSS